MGIFVSTDAFIEEGNSTEIRNFEEQMGLKEAPTLGIPIEDFLIKNSSSIQTLVNEFEQKLKDLSNGTLSYETVSPWVKEYAERLWTNAMEYVQGGANDDRPLYWARIKMEVAMKNHFKSQMNGTSVIENTELSHLIQLFEEKSRNYTGIDFIDVPEDKKKILITGFDPFGLYNKNNNDNIKRNNPSGIIALSLHGTDIEYRNNQTDKAPTAIGYIQSMIFPVRYEDFDKGYVERYIYPHLHEVDMIVTISQGRNKRYDIERFAGSWRGADHRDNMNRGKVKVMYYRVIESLDNEPVIEPILQVPPYLETKLPFDFMFEKGREFEIDVTFNQYLSKVGEEYDPIIGLSTLNDDCSLKTIDKEIREKDKIIGSGDDFLSNEIFYRVSLLRNSHNPTLKSGHLHVPILKDTFNTEKVLSETTKLLEYALKKL